MIAREIEFQEAAISFLGEHNIYPFSCVFTYSVCDGILGLTFYLSSDLLEVLDILDYKSQCDKSGFMILEKNNTLLLSGLALFNFYELARNI